jgi:hypothetical protein
MTDSIHLTAAQISGYLDGDLGQAERASVENHLDQCDACRAELAEVEVLANPEPSRGVTRRPYLWAIGGALAATLAGIVLVRSNQHGTVESIERPSLTPGEALPRVRIVAPVEGAVIGREERHLTWRQLPAGTYHVALLAEDGEPLWTLDTPDTSVALPTSVRLESGRTYFWRVDAVRDGVAATSGVVPFSIGPP